MTSRRRARSPSTPWSCAAAGWCSTRRAPAGSGPRRYAPSTARGRVPSSFLAQAVRIAAKDLRIEWRSREILATMTFLAVVVVLIFSFAFVVGDAHPPAPVTAGILWIALIVSGTVGLGRSFDREREGEAIRSLLLSPAPRGAIYLGKLAATIALMLVTEVILTALSGVLFSAGIGAQLGRVAALLALGTVGFAAVGCVFSAA